MNDAGRIGFAIKGDFDETTAYEFLDVVYYNGCSYVAKKSTIGNHPMRDSEFWHILTDNGITGVGPVYDMAETRDNLESGETFPDAFGKIQRHFHDMGDAAWTNVTDVTTTTIPKTKVVDATELNPDRHDTFARKLSEDIFLTVFSLFFTYSETGGDVVKNHNKGGTRISSEAAFYGMIKDKTRNIYTGCIIGMREDAVTLAGITDSAGNHITKFPNGIYVNVITDGFDENYGIEITKDSEITDLVTNYMEADLNDNKEITSSFNSLVKSLYEINGMNKYLGHKDISSIGPTVKDAIFDMDDVFRSTMPQFKTVRGNGNVMIEDTVEGPLILNDWTKNLIPYPYFDVSKTYNGITYNVNNDGSITISGTATSNSFFGLINKENKFIPPSSRLILSNNKIIKGFDLYSYGYDNELNDLGKMGDYKTGNGSLNIVSDVKYIDIYLYVASGTTINETIYPILEEIPTGADESEYPHPYVPYAGYTIKTYGRNLIPYPYTQNSFALNGIEYGIEKNGFINVKGTKNQESSWFDFMIFSLKAGKYAIDFGSDIDPSVVLFYVNLHDANGNFIRRVWDNTYESNIFTLDRDFSKVYVGLTVITYGAIDFTVTPMLEEIPEGADESEYPHAWEPYQSSSVTLRNYKTAPNYRLDTYKGVTHIMAPAGFEITYGINQKATEIANTTRNPNKDFITKYAFGYEYEGNGISGTGVDLNNYTKGGRYVITASATANDGFNFPINNGGYLDVVERIQNGTTLSNVWQFYHSFTRGSYIRCYVSSSNTWFKWISLTPTRSTAITEGEKYFVDAIELNAAVEGTLANYAHKLGDADSWIHHRNTYRDINLGNHITAEQLASIRDRSFKGLYVGCYWIINGIKYRIMDINYFLNTGHPSNTTKPHVLIIPDSTLYAAKMNDTNTTEGGYINSKMRTENLAQARTTIQAAFGAENIITHRDLFTKSVHADGYPNDGNWYDSDIELLSEPMIYGTKHFSHTTIAPNIVPYIYTCGKSQLAGFRLNPNLINTRQTYWLRDVVSSASFADVYSSGACDCAGASASLGVRPYFNVG